MQFTVVCSQRNEGPFLVEWVTWYRMLGFRRIVVVSNDCTDHSVALIEALAEAGQVRSLVHDVPDGRDIHRRKMAAAAAHPAVRRADWVLVCDVDEFLVIHRGGGRIGDLVAPDADFLGMAINWRVFGTSGRQAWEDGLTHRQFRQASPPRHRVSRWIKSIHSQPKRFRHLAEHGPKGYVADPSEEPDAPAPRWVNCDGVAIPDWRPDGPYLRLLGSDLVSHRAAQMNHYILRSEESFGLKRGTPSVVAGHDRYTDAFFLNNNRNEVTDDSALRYRGRFDRLHREAMARPAVRRLHHLCCADYIVRLAGKAGRDPADDPRHAHHLALAEA